MQTRRAVSTGRHRNSRDGQTEGKAEGMTDSERSGDPKGTTAYGTPLKNKLIYSIGCGGLAGPMLSRLNSTLISQMHLE
ncbi:MAG: hypothetical protein WD431_09480 [Cyclobacteriaceae bacterium]